MKRYCQTLELYDDKELIEAYVAEHAHVWEEVKAGIREVGITDMQIYIDGNRLFMIMDTTDEFDMERIMHGWLPCPVRRNGKRTWRSSRKLLRELPRRRNGS